MQGIPTTFKTEWAYRRCPKCYGPEGTDDSVTLNVPPHASIPSLACPSLALEELVVRIRPG